MKPRMTIKKYHLGFDKRVASIQMFTMKMLIDDLLVMFDNLFKTKQKIMSDAL